MINMEFQTLIHNTNRSQKASIVIAWTIVMRGLLVRLEHHATAHPVDHEISSPMSFNFGKYLDDNQHYMIGWVEGHIMLREHSKIY